MSRLKTLLVPLTLFWQLLNQFLLSPWGLVVPMTLLLLFVAVQQVQKTPVQLAMFYAEKFDTCTEAELVPLIEVLVQMEDAGVPGLVKGLTSHRESVFTACLNVLQNEFDRWRESDQREHHFLVFSETLLRMSNQFSPIAQTEVMRFVEQIMQIRTVAPASPQSIADRQQTIGYCEQLLAQLESMRRRRIEPQDTAFAPQNNSITSLDRYTKQPALLASNGQPFVPASVRQDKANETYLADAESFNPFSAARADRLWAYQQSLHYRPAAESPTDSTAKTEAKFAQNFTANDFAPPPTLEPQPSDISEDYRNQKRTEVGGTFSSDNFLTPELVSVPLDRVPQLSPTQLMQLLHHPDPSYIESARKTLISRDGFQEPHLKLAWRLYHPIPAVRQEIVGMLPNIANIQPSVWLTVLLSDPNGDVRYRAASFLATTSDPALRRLLIDRGRRDNDSRIVSLAERLDIPQQGPVRR